MAITAMLMLIFVTQIFFPLLAVAKLFFAASVSVFTPQQFHFSFFLHIFMYTNVGEMEVNS